MVGNLTKKRKISSAWGSARGGGGGGGGWTLLDLTHTLQIQSIKDNFKLTYFSHKFLHFASGHSKNQTKR